MSEHADVHQASPELATDIVGVGEMLRTTREGRGLTLVDVAQALKLTQRQVEALESERFDALPGAAFARGFLRNYARLLGLDPEPLIDALAQTSGVGAPELAPISNAQGTLPAGDGALRPSAFPIALIALLLLVAVVGGWYFDWFQQADAPGPDSAVVDTPVAPAALTPVIPPADNAPLVIPDDAPSGSATDAVPPASSNATGLPAAAPAVTGMSALPLPAPAPATATAPTATAPTATATTATAPAVPAAATPVAAVAPPAATLPAAPATAAASNNRLVFRFTTESWVEVRDASGEIIFSRTNRPGTVQEVTGKPPYRLVIGNAKSVELEYAGKPVDLAPYIKVSVARLTLE